MLTKQADERAIPIPPDLRNYLTVTSQPNENFLVLQHNRERHLRLLLRRFTNQIQYGCKNPYCNVPTCLSFRKRRSSVPVRPYSDIAARTMAWRCVEDYTGDEGQPNVKLHAGSVNRRKTKVKVDARERTSSLCWNEPVIPWYEDPAEFLRKRRQERCFKQGLSSPSENSRLRSSSEAVPFNNNRSSHTGIVAMDPRQDRTPTSPRTQVTQAAQAQKDQTMKEQAATPPIECASDGSMEQSQRFGMLEKDETASELVVEQPKDTASFSQAFHDTAAIKDLDHLSGKQNWPKSDKKSDEHNIHDHPRESNTAADEIRPGTASQPLLARTSTYTFKILNKRVMSWLLTLVTNSSSERILLDDSPTVSMSVTDLARQSIHYCLSHPFRLMDSAEQWSSGTLSGSSATDDIGPESSTSALHGAAKLHDGYKDTTRCSRHRVPNLRDSYKAFEVLHCIQPHPMIMNSIFMALQHSFKLPPNLQHSQLRGFSVWPDSSYNQTSQLGMNSDSSLDAQASSHLEYLTDEQVASLCLICLLSIIHQNGRADQSLEFPLDEATSEASYFQYVWCNNLGEVFPKAHLYWTFDRTKDTEWRSKYSAVLAHVDANEDPHLLRTLESLGSIISHRLAVHETMKAVKSLPLSKETSGGVVELLVSQLHDCDHSQTRRITLALVDLMHVALLKKWDRRPIIRRASAIGGVLQMLAGLYRHRVKLGLPAKVFTIEFVAEAFDAFKMPLEWLAFRQNSKDMHILSCSFLFRPQYLVKYFRAINVETMRKSHEYASINHATANYFLTNSKIPVYGTLEVLAELRPHMARYFVLTIRRGNMLEDAIDQIWRRQRQELMRPLKVHLGKDEGEGGLDHGGVQQEFFRLVLAAALDPNYGMFTIDEPTRMTWFQPGSLEPLYKFEAIGILMSLAVYNAVTLPVTFPLAFYRKLLGLKVKHLEHIEDGWPDLAKGLKSLKDWEDGDVGEVMNRTYEFSYCLFDKVVTIDMSRVGRGTMWPPNRRRKVKDYPKTATFEAFNLESVISPEDSSSSVAENRSHKAKGSKSSNISKREIRIQVHTPSVTPQSNLTSPSPSDAAEEEAPLVTNANRKQYIKDYIFWLTNKSIAPQFEAFSKGFFTCLDTTALSIFTAEALKTVVEGHTEIDIDELQATTVYEEFSATDQIILDFWDIVKTSMDAEQHKRLLEFVTASDRVPVNGISTITFIIQKNGDDDERLPSSSTCYGRLLLPAYSSKEIMKEKLEKAIENSVGFGSL